MYTGLNADKFETTTYRLTHLLTRVKSRDASASKNKKTRDYLGVFSISMCLDLSYLTGGCEVDSDV